jgi:SAM-dependent methyltransferase
MRAVESNRTQVGKSLLEIQSLQFSDRGAAEACLLEFLRENEDSAITRVQLNPKPESLNSMNGFIWYGENERYFFKTHVEQNEQLVEYYNSDLLRDAGYPVVAARRISHRPGKQIALYEVLTYPTLFDLVKQAEDAGVPGSRQPVCSEENGVREVQSQCKSESREVGAVACGAHALACPENESREVGAVACGAHAKACPENESREVEAVACGAHAKACPENESREVEAVACGAHAKACPENESREVEAVACGAHAKACPENESREVEAVACGARAGCPPLEMSVSAITYGGVVMESVRDSVEPEQAEACAPRANAVQARTPSSQSLIVAQQQLDQQVFANYKSTLQYTDAATHAVAPIHQLFSHRLDERGRLGLFYRGKTLSMEGIENVDFDVFAALRWKINGVCYDQTLNDLIEQSVRALRPQAGASVVGHGDAHNGNVFYDSSKNGSLLFFDPAFAGRHSPLLDIAKPLFHNVFARWMYFPEQVSSDLTLQFQIASNRIELVHDFFPSELRLAMLDSRIRNVLTPTVAMLRENGMLPDDWHTYLRSALFCCPFLTVNLFAPYVVNGTLAERYGMDIRMLAFAMAVELAAVTKQGTSKVTDLIESVFA